VQGKEEGIIERGPASEYTFLKKKNQNTIYIYPRRFKVEEKAKRRGEKRGRGRGRI